MALQGEQLNSADAAAQGMGQDGELTHAEQLGSDAGHALRLGTRSPFVHSQ